MEKTILVERRKFDANRVKTGGFLYKMGKKQTNAGKFVGKRKSFDKIRRCVNQVNSLENLRIFHNLLAKFLFTSPPGDAMILSHVV